MRMGVVRGTENAPPDGAKGGGGGAPKSGDPPPVDFVNQICLETSIPAEELLPQFIEECVICRAVRKIRQGGCLKEDI